MKHLSIAQRLWLPAGVVAAVVATILTLTIVRTSSTQAAAQAQQNVQNEKLELALRWEGATAVNHVRTSAVIAAQDSAYGKAILAELQQSGGSIDEQSKRLEALSLTPKEKAAFAQAISTQADYFAARNAAIAAKAEGETEQAMQLLRDKVTPAMAAYSAAQKAVVELQHVQAQDLVINAGHERWRSVAIAGVSLIVIVLILFASTWLLAQSVLPRLRHVSSLAQRVGQGDLTVSVHQTRSDELGELECALKAMVDALRTVVSDVRQTAQQIGSASTEIATGNQDLSVRTEQTASNLQETASSMEQLTGAVTQSSDAAQKASQLASSAASVAARGGDVVSSVVDTMKDIEGSSSKISEIISVIDGIAFQTNILALNAAVEAARAGEQGRGFAVVASEVRSLAQRSSDAAKEINTLITESVMRVGQGSALVSEAGLTMSEIVRSVQRVSAIIGEVSSASTEQSTGIREINQAMTQLDQMTQQNAALVEQSAAAAESLKDQAQRLNSTIASFKLDAA